MKRWMQLLIGVVVLGNEIVYTFATGEQVVMGMPDGSILEKDLSES